MSSQSARNISTYKVSVDGARLSVPSLVWHEAKLERYKLGQGRSSLFVLSDLRAMLSSFLCECESRIRRLWLSGYLLRHVDEGGPACMRPWVQLPASRLLCRCVAAGMWIKGFLEGREAETHRSVSGTAVGLKPAMASFALVCQDYLSRWVWRLCWCAASNLVVFSRKSGSKSEQRVTSRLAFGHTIEWKSESFRSLSRLVQSDVTSSIADHSKRFKLLEASWRKHLIRLRFTDGLLLRSGCLPTLPRRTLQHGEAMWKRRVDALIGFGSSALHLRVSKVSALSRHLSLSRPSTGSGRVPVMYAGRKNDLSLGGAPVVEHIGAAPPLLVISDAALSPDRTSKDMRVAALPSGDWLLPSG